jgi:hypothetical protein
VFRIHYARKLNPGHEVFGGRVAAGTAISRAGAVALSVSIANILQIVALPSGVVAVLTWHWP